MNENTNRYIIDPNADQLRAGGFAPPHAQEVWQRQGTVLEVDPSHVGSDGTLVVDKDGEVFVRPEVGAEGGRYILAMALRPVGEGQAEQDGGAEAPTTGDLEAEVGRLTGTVTALTAELNRVMAERDRARESLQGLDRVDTLREVLGRIDGVGDVLVMDGDEVGWDDGEGTPTVAVILEGVRRDGGAIVPATRTWKVTGTVTLEVEAEVEVEAVTEDEARDEARGYLWGAGYSADADDRDVTLYLAHLSDVANVEVVEVDPA